jgi:hypothetical protein
MNKEPNFQIAIVGTYTPLFLMFMIADHLISPILISRRLWTMQSASLGNSPENGRCPAFIQRLWNEG